MERKTLWVGIAVMAVVGLAALIVLWTGEPEYNAAVYDPPLPAADFELTDQTNQAFRLGDQRGRIVLLFFGYTHCPDVCPLTMAKLRRVFDLLGSQSSQVEVVFVTTDPQRDTPEELNTYLSNFNPDFTGLTGERTALEAVWRSYGVTVLDDGATHSARVYVIDPQGALRMTFHYEMEPEAMASDLRLLMRDR